MAFFTATGQSCPPNIDFETSTFNGWKCYTGNTTAVNGQNVISLNETPGPMYDHQTMYSAFPGDGVDPYGGFPVNCPNGSGHSIRLGNSSGGGEAEGISYEFTIPPDENAYTLIYHYAVVFQDPNHQEYEQPRMQIEITNVTDNTVISCASFAFHPYGSTLPGFQTSPNPGSNTPVQYKDWSAVSIDLAGNAGKTIRLFFKTADCTFRRHFGYAYIDVNSECSGTFVGATYCPGDTAINVVAPYGYQNYTWYNSTLNRVLGNQQILRLSPPPPSGTEIAVKLIPYNGYGCPQTLTARLVDTLKVIANAGADTFSCNHNPVPIGAIPKQGLVYSWSPTAGLTNPSISNPYASPDTTTTYYITTNHDGGGCITKDTVVVKASLINNALEVIGKATYCTGTGDSAILRVHPTDSVQWFKDNVAIAGARQTEYKVTESGLYHAMLYNASGCSLPTSAQQINIASIPVAGFMSPPTPAQCLVGNKFVFSNTSTNVLGRMQYQWIMGDGTQATTKDVIYSYSRAGIYNVKLVTSSNSICADSSMFTVQIHQNAVAEFSVDPVCVNLPVTFVNSTVDTMGSPVNYVWNLANGQVSNLRTPPPQVYSTPGPYPITLSVNTDQCPSPYNTIKRTLVIDKPKPGITYPVEYAVINLPLTLEARTFGEKVLWSPANSLDNPTSYTPVFKGSSEQRYTIDIKTAAGCLTTDTVTVKTVRKVEVYVPTAFTPDHDGNNDFLRPLCRGIKQVYYFRVFNRWGQLLYEVKNDQPGWDGTYHGVPQQSQTVVWMIQGLGVDGNVYTQKGASTLLR